ncbi:DMP19 family protein [Actinoplanes regularis]|uniref:DNA mimic protein DMP19 C-terminal domain-containing protein n=1 Tax=Actinoplanes regularis TaxID=52697 RepID=A0A238Y830_9ACTN|nr:hypothetical protein [Actinoplanes regularis]GIE86136.1 hypothetical protein Are01nite_26160 [Actinoplanes regularis]SNR66803.1 hypothetical protein SAMN06264365_104313 [Actinoplanes regularis]
MNVIDAVWKRACGHQGGGVGDRHLSALLLVHGAMLNGGAGTAVVGFDPAELRAAVEACEYFGLNGLASLFREIPAAAASADDEERLNAAFQDMDPDGLMVPAAFEDRYAATPEDFDPVAKRRFGRGER